MKKQMIGYCRICGKLRELSEDHIPPQSCGNKSPVEYYFGSKRIISQNGLKFKTICTECNNERLGAIYDKELMKLYNEVKPIYNTKLYLTIKYSIIEFNTQNVIKSLLGHFLAARHTEKEEYNNILMQPLGDEGIFDNYREYFLGNNNKLDGFQIFYWYYPYETIKIYPYFAFIPDYFGQGNYPIYGSLFKFFPISVFILNNNSSKSSFTFEKLRHDVDERKITLRLQENVPKDWPEIPDRKGIVLMNSKSTIKAQKRKC